MPAPFYPETMTPKALKTRLEAARTERDGLLADLPAFERLLVDNEHEVSRLRDERAALDVQAAAKGRVMVARELLEQHQADIREAEALIAELESELETITAVDRLRKLERDLVAARRPFAERALAAYHTFLNAAAELRAEHADLCAKAAEANQLRARLLADTPPTERRTRLEALGAQQPAPLVHHPPRSWALRDFVEGRAAGQLQSRVLGLLDTLARDPQADPESVKLSLKENL